jgi:hypothetical protein
MSTYHDDFKDIIYNKLIITDIRAIFNQDAEKNDIINRTL